MHCIVLYCNALYCYLLYCIVMYYKFYYIIMHCFVFCYFVIHYYFFMHCTAIHCTVLMAKSTKWYNCNQGFGNDNSVPACLKVPWTGTIYCRNYIGSPLSELFQSILLHSHLIPWFPVFLLFSLPARSIR